LKPIRRNILKAAFAAPLLWARARSQAARPALSEALVDAAGVMRWRPSGEEINLFGVNYGLPSASAYRFLKASGADPLDTVRADLTHLQRLGSDAVRLAFWGDWETSDVHGNLIENEHLLLLDEVLCECHRRGMRVLLSPIVTYDASWPDAMRRQRAGFSSAYKKDRLGLDAAAITAQCNYLRQLLERKNHCSMIPYKNDPAIFAIEPINEPTHHPEVPDVSIRYVSALCRAIRGTGCNKLIVYNVSQDMQMAAILARTPIDGATFAWYPTGLQAGRPVAGNSLLLVDEYAQMHDPALKAKAKLVYEFDAADSMASYMYPAMARAFRGGGAQFAAMFSYDPLPIAAGNLEFNDHFLNLVYTPAKAVSFLIAREAFRRIARGRDFGLYPRNMHFDAFTVDDRADRSELMTEDAHLYSNDTQTAPTAPQRLQRVAGVGSSPVVGYEGVGAYFLDRLADGAWRLEVYPDAAIVANPFDHQRPGRTVSQLVWRSRAMRLALPDLGSSFVAESVPDNRAVHVRDGAFSVTPGVYLLRRNTATIRPALETGFVAPAPTPFEPVLLHEPPTALPSDQAWTCRAEYVAAAAPDALTLHYRISGGAFRTTPMTLERGFGFSEVVLLKDLGPGVLDYFISVRSQGAITTFPNRVNAEPGDWDFPRDPGWRCPVLGSDSPVVLFDAAADFDHLIVPYGGYQSYPYVSLRAGASLTRNALTLDGRELERAPHKDIVCQLNLPPSTLMRIDPARGFRSVAVQGRSRGAGGKVAIILIERDGATWGAVALLKPDPRSVVLELKDFIPVQAAMLPRDFPVGINPYWLRSPNLNTPTARSLNLANLQAIQLSVGSRFILAGDEPHPLLDIEWVQLQH
jgi:hypothetical protein